MEKIFDGLDRAKELGMSTYKDMVKSFARDSGKPWKGEVNDKIFVNAYVDYGRWLADCPGCGTPQYVALAEPLFCSVCGNEFAEGKAIRVDFPANKSEIEAELLLRQVFIKYPHPMPTQGMLVSRPVLFGLGRGWQPHETVEDLKLQRLTIERANSEVVK